MTKWNHRIVRDGDFYVVCEVIYKTNGKPWLWSKGTPNFFDSKEDLIEYFEMLLKDIKTPNRNMLKVSGDKLVVIKKKKE